MSGDHDGNRRYFVEGKSINTFTLKIMRDGRVVTDDYLAGMGGESRDELLDQIALASDIVIVSMIEGLCESVIEYPLV